MTKSISISLATALLISATQPVWADHGENFHCDRMPFLSDQAKAAMNQLAHNNGMRKIVSFYAWQWENEEMRRICDAGAAGENVDTSCLEGRRDWDAIAAKIPEGLAGQSNKELRPHMLELTERGYHTTDRKEVMSYCAKLGVVDSVFE
ncbi:MAG: hypothetical protein JJ891_18140 [Rhizobiaceae bacterium]|nr:hypothetical protein [Rhizobiaceae bacterium]